MSSSQSLDRGLSILEMIDRSPSPLGIREIGRQLDLSAAVIQRLVNSLATRGFVEQELDSRRYRIGYRSVSLGMSNRHGDSMVSAAHIHLIRLAEQHGLNGFLGVLTGGKAVYVLCVPSRHRVLLRVDVGETMPFHTTALGKVLLAAAGENKAQALLGSKPLAKITAHSLTDPKEILAQLPEVRRQGYAAVFEENIPGIISVGAPVRDKNGNVVAGLSVAYSSGTTTLSTPELIELVVTSATVVSQSLGCPETSLDKWSVES